MNEHNNFNKSLLQQRIEEEQVPNKGRFQTEVLLSGVIAIVSFFLFYGKQISNFISSALLTYTGYGIGTVSSDNVLEHFTAGFLGKDQKPVSKPLTQEEFRQLAAAQAERDEFFPVQRPSASSLGGVTMRRDHAIPAAKIGSLGGGGLDYIKSSAIKGETLKDQYGNYTLQTQTARKSGGSFDNIRTPTNNPMFNSFVSDLSYTISKGSEQDIRDILSSPSGWVLFDKYPAAKDVLMKYMRNSAFKRMLLDLPDVQYANIYKAVYENSSTDNTVQTAKRQQKTGRRIPRTKLRP